MEFLGAGGPRPSIPAVGRVSRCCSFQVSEIEFIRMILRNIFLSSMLNTTHANARSVEGALLGSHLATTASPDSLTASIG